MALVDRGYCQPAALVETQQQGADWIVRWNSGMPLWTPTGEELTTYQFAASLGITDCRAHERSGAERNAPDEQL